MSSSSRVFARVGTQCLLQLHHCREQDVVLLVNVQMGIGLELRESLETGTVRRAAVGRDPVVVGRGPETGEPEPGESA